MSTDRLAAKGDTSRATSRSTARRPGGLHRWTQWLLRGPAPEPVPDIEPESELFSQAPGATRIHEELVQQQICAELKARLDSENQPVAEVMRHLAYVRSILRHQGWRGVGVLPHRVLSKALVQAKALAAEAASPLLQVFVERLHLLAVAAELIEEGAVREAAGSAQAQHDEAAYGYRSTMHMLDSRPVSGNAIRTSVQAG